MMDYSIYGVDVGCFYMNEYMVGFGNGCFDFCLFKY